MKRIMLFTVLLLSVSTMSWAMGGTVDPPPTTPTTSTGPTSTLPGPFGTWDKLTQSSANYAYGNTTAQQALAQQQQALNNPFFDLLTWPLLP